MNKEVALIKKFFITESEDSSLSSKIYFHSQTIDKRMRCVINYQYGKSRGVCFSDMIVLGKERIQKFISKHMDCKKAVLALVLEIKSSDWKTPSDIKKRYPKASIIGKNNVVFDICGNRYRIWLKIAYRNGVAIIVKLGTHQQYDLWEIK